MAKTQRKWFEIAITEEGQAVSKTFELDKNMKFILGMLITSDRDDLLYYRGSQRIELNKEELFPEGYESKLLMSGINVNPNRRYYELGKMPAGVGSIKFDFKDTPTSFTVFEAYKVRLYVDSELE